jgi:ABC-type nitrate/sulfonate/bicarbonate transport system substrate-binding protein
VESGETVREWRLERHGVDVRDSTFGQYVDERDAARRGKDGLDGTLMIGGDARGIVGARKGVRVRACACVLTASCVIVLAM